MIIKGLSPDGDPAQAPGIVHALNYYAESIGPWAHSVAKYMIADVLRRDAKMWHSHSKEIGRALRQELTTAPTGDLLRRLQNDQVELIKSIPTVAAQRVHTLAMESTITGTRAGLLAKQILETEKVTAARARLIARTETSRAASNLVQSRAQWLGSDGYVWRTSDDADVRDSHAEMEGQYVRWSSPPKLDGLVGHAGCLPNCRCYAEPIFPKYN